jgi:large subunit ribosomal protein L10
MSKIVKEMIVDTIRQRLGSVRDLVIVDSSRLDALSVNKLRLKLRSKGIFVLGVKNSLARKVLEGMGVRGLETLLQGPSALVWGGSDMVALARELMSAAKDHAKLEIRGGTLDGAPLTSKDVESLSKGPGREELLSQIVGRILGPGAQLAAAILGPGGDLAGRIESKAKEPEGEAA